MSYIFIIILFALLAGIVSSIFQIPLWLISVLFILVIVIRLAYILYMTYQSKNLAQLEKFLSNSNNPLHQLIFSYKDGSKEEKIKANETMISKYNSPVVHGTYKANIAILNRDYKNAIHFANSIPNMALKNYTSAYVEALIGKKSNVAKYTLAQPWMKSLIAAIVAYRNKDMETFENEKTKTLLNSKGIQYFENYYILENLPQIISK